MAMYSWLPIILKNSIKHYKKENGKIPSGFTILTFHLTVVENITYTPRENIKNWTMDILTRPAEEFENDQTVEAMWAMKAYEHAEIYFNILCSVDPKYLKLTPLDDVIYKIFREEFPDLRINIINENDLKSGKAKERWRLFCERFKKCVEDYSFGTLLRIDASKDYTEDNTILVTRIQFYAIELARNKEGVNDNLRKVWTGSNSREY